jgi:predicted N-acyltransferase
MQASEKAMQASDVAVQASDVAVHIRESGFADFDRFIAILN